MEKKIAALLSENYVECIGVIPCGDEKHVVQFYPDKMACILVSNGLTLAADNNVGCRWISVDEEMPPEHESMFIKLYGTKQWTKAMFRTVSKEVLCRVQYADGSEAVKMLYTRDGDWTKMGLTSGRVTHWMPTDRLLELLREEK